MKSETLLYIFSQWVDGSVTDFVWWDQGYPPLNHRDCLAAFPGLGWRDVHCHRVGDGQGAVVMVTLYRLTTYCMPGLPGSLGT